MSTESKASLKLSFRCASHFALLQILLLQLKYDRNKGTSSLRLSIRYPEERAAWVFKSYVPFSRNARTPTPARLSPISKLNLEALR